MNEDIMRMAIEAGWDAHHAEFDTRIQKLSTLVASVEREACAKLCADWSDYTNGIAPTLAKAIRARGQV